MKIRATQAAEWAGVLLVVLLIMCCAYFAIEGWFDPMQFKVLAGDDLRSFTAAQRGFHSLNDLFASVYRFRPVAAAAIWAVASWAHSDFRAAANIGIAIHTVNALLLLFLLRRVIRLSAILSFGLVTIAILNRFVTYLYIQEEALTEGLGISVLLILIILVIKFVEKPSLVRGVVIGFLYLVIIHLHERYLVMGAPLFLVGVCRFSSSRSSSGTMLFIVGASALFNLAIKKLVLATPILVGTTTHAIEFNVPQIGRFLLNGAQSLIGINRGPAHLSLEDFANSPVWIQLVSVATAVISFCLILVVLRSVSSNRRHRVPGGYLLIVGFLSLTTALLLLAASITIRQEFRWLYSAYLTFLILIAIALSRVVETAWAESMLISWIILSMTKETYLARWHSRFFGFEADRTANELYQTLDRIRVPRGTGSIVIQGSVPAREWVFMGEDFARMYHLPHLEFVQTDSMVERDDQDRVWLRYSTTKHSFELAAPAVGTIARWIPENVSTLQTEAQKLPVERTLATPAKKRMFAMEIDGEACIVAVSPIKIAIEVPRQARMLRVRFSHVYAIGDGLNLELTAISATKGVDLLTKDVPALKSNDSPHWCRYDLDLPPRTKQIELRVFSASGDPTADWLAFRNFCFE